MISPIVHQVLDGTFAIRSAVVRVARIAVTVLATLGSAGVRSERKAPAFRVGRGPARASAFPAPATVLDEESATEFAASFRERGVEHGDRVGAYG